MTPLPEVLERLLAELGKLPGVGRRSAERMAFSLLAAPEEQARALASALGELHTRIGTCPVCGYFTEDGRCPVCEDPSRDGSLLCIVEDPMDVIAFERAGGYRGRYHVLGGLLSPLKGIGPSDLRVAPLLERVASPEVREIILATSPGVEGDATSIYLSRELERDGLLITRIGRGVPVGGALELIDSGTLRMALEGRRGFS